MSIELHSEYNKDKWGLTAKEQGKEGSVDKKKIAKRKHQG